METASNIINDALREIIVSPAEVSIDSYDAQVGVFYLNAMMSDFSANGINLGYTFIDSLGDDVTVDPAAYDAIVKNLAVVISPVYKETFASQSLFEQAEEGYKSLLEVSFDQTGYTPYSYNLPVGSGNYDYRPGRFYAEPLEPIFTENSGNIAPESAPDDS